MDPYKHDDYLYEKFIKRDEEGWYEPALVWKEGNSEIHNACDIVIQEQVQNKIIERASNNENSNCKLQSLNP